MLKAGPFSIDQEAGEVRKGRARIPLQPGPYRALVALVKKAGEVVSADELARALGTRKRAATNVGVRRNLFLLRQALGTSSGGRDWVETVHGHGYRFVDPKAKKATAKARGKKAARSGKLSVGPFRIDLKAETVHKGKRAVYLQPQLYQLFVLLAKQPNVAVSRAELEKKIWGVEISPSSGLRRNVVYLREALGKKPGGGEWIETVHRHGYRLVE